MAAKFLKALTTMCGTAAVVGIPNCILKAAMLVKPVENSVKISSLVKDTTSGVKILPSSYTHNTNIPYLNGLISNFYNNVASL